MERDGKQAPRGQVFFVASRRKTLKYNGKNSNTNLSDKSIEKEDATKPLLTET
jgi:hypothetical protein